MLIRRVFSILFLGLLLVFLADSCKNSETGNDFVYPADFDPSASTCFFWTADFHQIVAQIAGIISAKDKVTLYVGKKDADIDFIENTLKKYHGNLQNIKIVQLEKNPKNAWIRDFGPVYLVNSKGQKKLVNFYYYGNRHVFNNQIAEKQNIPIVQSTISSTGGAREVNGKGTMLLCEAHELEENKPKTKQQIEEELKNDLSLKKIIWLKQGIPQDDSKYSGPLYDDVYPNGVNGHMDEFCRFADASTILISSVSESEANSHSVLAEAKKRLDENYNILVNATDQDGNKFKVIKVPYAPLVITRRLTSQTTGYMATVVTSYMNFIVTNSFVILPSYMNNSDDSNREIFLAREKEVENIFRQVFPSKEIVKVEAAELNRFGGGFHCISINEPL